MGDGITVGSGAAAVVGAAIGVVVGVAVEAIVLAAICAGGSRDAVAVCTATVGCCETAIVCAGVEGGWEQAARSKASKIRAGKAAAFLTRLSLGDKCSSVDQPAD